MIGACCIEDCTNYGRIVRGMCIAHYKRWQRWGDPEIILRAPNGSRDRAICTIVNCGRPVTATGLCATHYAQARAYHNYDGETRPIRPHSHDPIVQKERERVRSERYKPKARARAKKLSRARYGKMTAVLDTLYELDKLVAKERKCLSQRQQNPLQQVQRQVYEMLQFTSRSRSRT